jgi:lipoyl-dependent peroxiredoxin
MAVGHTASATWEGDLMGGSGTVSLGSGAATGVPLTWKARAEDASAGASPEELIAAALASCFSMALSHGLTQAGNPPDHLDVSAKVTLDQVGDAPTVTTSELTVTGRVPGIDQAAFERAAADAGMNCPISRALGGLDIKVVEATLA